MRHRPTTIKITVWNFLSFTGLLNLIIVNSSIKNINNIKQYNGRFDVFNTKTLKNDTTSKNNSKIN